MTPIPIVHVEGDFGYTEWECRECGEIHRWIEDAENCNHVRHESTDEVVCPWCGYEYLDSWEFPDSTDYECDECGKKFYLSRDVSVTYSTSKIK